MSEKTNEFYMPEKEGYINITNDGGIKKKIINEGYGEKPDEGSRVFISYMEKNLNDKSIKNQNIIKTVFNIGNNRVIKGWIIGVKTMKVGEKSIFILSPDYSDIPLKSPNITSKVDKIYEIELIKFELPTKIITQRFDNRGLSEDKSKNNNKEKININEVHNIRKKIPLIRFNKNKYGYIRKEKPPKSTDKQIGNKNIIKINKKYGFKTYLNLKMKTDAPICDKCFRLIYISFDFIKNYISTKCPYCNKFDIYKYDSFIGKLISGINPLTNSLCSKCLKCFLYSENTFYLIEKKL